MSTIHHIACGNQAVDCDHAPPDHRGTGRACEQSVASKQGSRHLTQDSDLEGGSPSEPKYSHRAGTEQVEYDINKASRERNVDDLILRAAIWQAEHWSDRSSFLDVNEDMRDTTGASKVVLLSFDRMRTSALFVSISACELTRDSHRSSTESPLA